MENCSRGPGDIPPPPHLLWTWGKKRVSCVPLVSQRVVGGRPGCGFKPSHWQKHPVWKKGQNPISSRNDSAGAVLSFPSQKLRKSIFKEKQKSPEKSSSKSRPPTVVGRGGEEINNDLKNQLPTQASWLTNYQQGFSHLSTHILIPMWKNPNISA